MPRSETTVQPSRRAAEEPVPPDHPADPGSPPPPPRQRGEGSPPTPDMMMMRRRRMTMMMMIIIVIIIVIITPPSHRGVSVAHPRAKERFSGATPRVLPHRMVGCQRVRAARLVTPHWFRLCCCALMLRARAALCRIMPGSRHGKALILYPAVLSSWSPTHDEKEATIAFESDSGSSHPEAGGMLKRQVVRALSRSSCAARRFARLERRAAFRGRLREFSLRSPHPDGATAPAKALKPPACALAPLPRRASRQRRVP